MTVMPSNGFGPAPLATGCAAWDDGALVPGFVLAGAVAGDDDAVDVDGWSALLDDAAELCGADVEAAVGLDDDPHAVSSSASDPNPAATAHPLLRMRSPYRPPWDLRVSAAVDDVRGRQLDHVPQAVDAVAGGGQRPLGLE